MNEATPPADDRSDPHPHPSVGPLVTEAALLLGAVEDKLQAWQSDQIRGAAGSAGAADAPDPDDDVAATRPCPECGSVPGAPCTGCPVCRLLAAVRGERPEVTARVVDGALTIVRALRTLLPADAPPPPAGRPAGPPSGTTGSGDAPRPEPTNRSAPGAPRPSGPRPAADRPAPRPGLQRIDIT